MKTHRLAAALPGLALALSLFGQTAPQPSPETAADTIVLSPFEVRATEDQGYRAANSVTASRFALPILDTPMSIQVVTEEFMKDIGARDQLDALSFVSGITQGNSPVRLEGSNTFNIRGQSTSFSLRDGVLSYGINDGYNIERYEVLKGINGMMYGSRNLGGVINAVSKKPREKFSGEVFFRTDEYGSWRLQGDVNVPLNTARTVLFRLNGFTKDEGTFMRDERLAGQGITTSLTVIPLERVKFTAEYEYYDQNNTLATKLPPLQLARGPRFVNDTMWNQRVGYPDLPKDFNYGGKESYLNETNRIVNGTLDVKVFDWLNFRSYASYSVRAQDRLNRDGGATFTENGFAANSATDNVPIAPLNVFNWATGTTSPATAAQVPYVTGLNSNLREFKNWDFIWRNDLLAQYHLLGFSHRTLVGYEYQERSGDFRAFDSYAPVTLDGRNPNAAAMRAIDARGRVNFDVRTFDPYLPMPTREEIWARRISDPNDRFGSFNGSTNETVAYYATHYLQGFRDRLTVMGGIRRDRDRTKRAYSYTRDLSARTYNSGLPGAWNSRNSPQVGAAWRFRDDLSVYATWSDVLVANNSRAGDPFIDQLVNTNGVWSLTTAALPDLEPQTGVNEEIGLKTEFFNGRLSGTLALFRTVLKNKPFTISRTDSANITMPPGGTLAAFAYRTLAGEERSQGVELDFTWSVSRNWSTLFSYAYTDATVTKDSQTVTFDTSPQAGNQNLTVPFFQGYMKGNVPEHQAKFWSNYRFEASSGLLHNAGIGTGARYYTESPSLGQFNTYNQINPAYLVVDLSLWKKFKLYGRDLGVTFRITNLFDKDYIGTRQIYGTPREMILEARYKF